MSPGVLGQVVATHEAAEAHGTGKPFLAGVGTSVARQLVRACESPLTSLPLAFEGLLPYWSTNSEVEAGVYLDFFFLHLDAFKSVL